MEGKRLRWFFWGVRARCSSKRLKERGVKCLITEEEIAFLWKRDGASAMNYPQLDRIDTNGNYELVNCRFIPRAENISRSSRWKITNGGAMKDQAIRIDGNILLAVKKLAKSEGRTVKGQIERMLQTAFSLYADQERARRAK